MTNLKMATFHDKFKLWCISSLSFSGSWIFLKTVNKWSLWICALDKQTVVQHEMIRDHTTSVGYYQSDQQVIITCSAQLATQSRSHLFKSQICSTTPASLRHQSPLVEILHYTSTYSQQQLMIIPLQWEVGFHSTCSNMTKTEQQAAQQHSSLSCLTAPHIDQ